MQLPNFAHAQVFGRDDSTSQHGAFIEGVVKFTPVVGKSGILTGIRAGWIIDGRVSVGLGLYRLSNDVLVEYTDWESKDKPFLEFNYGGLDLEYRQDVLRDVQLSAGLILAGGGVGFIFPNDAIGKHRNLYYNRNALLWEAQLGIRYTVFEWLHVTAGGGYRHVAQMDDAQEVTRANMRGAAGTLGVRLGR